MPLVWKRSHPFGLRRLGALLANENQKIKLADIPPLDGIICLESEEVFPEWLRMQSASFIGKIRPGTYDLLEY
jgi:hypothetical protein